MQIHGLNFPSTEVEFVGVGLRNLHFNQVPLPLREPGGSRSCSAAFAAYPDRLLQRPTLSQPRWPPHAFFFFN